MCTIDIFSNYQEFPISSIYLSFYNSIMNKKKTFFIDSSKSKKKSYILQNQFNLFNNFIIPDTNIINYKTTLKKKITKYKKQIQNNKNIFFKDIYNDYDLVRRIDEYREKYKNTYLFTNIYDYIDNININNTQCPICDEKIKKNHIILTDCGHIFCIQCILEWGKYEFNCPQCRKSLSINNVFHIIDNKEKPKLLEFYSIDYLKKILGNKNSSVIKYIYSESLQNNVLLLSDNNNILKNISKILNRFNLDNYIYTDKIEHKKIILLNYNLIGNFHLLSDKNTIIFYEKIENIKKEYNLLNKITDYNLNKIVNIIHFTYNKKEKILYI